MAKPKTIFERKLAMGLKTRTRSQIKRLKALLDGKQAGDWSEQLDRFLARDPCWVDPLEQVSVVAIPANNAPFFAGNHFSKGGRNRRDPKITSRWSDFETRYLLPAGKIEENVPRQSLGYYKIRYPSSCREIIERFGGKEKVVTTLSAVYTIMMKQRGRKWGYLLMNRYSNFFFIEDVVGALGLVTVYRFQEGWGLGCYSIDDHRTSDALIPGSRIFLPQVVPA